MFFSLLSSLPYCLSKDNEKMSLGEGEKKEKGKKRKSKKKKQ